MPLPNFLQSNSSGNQLLVVSAKDITPEERRRLHGHIEALIQKGSMQPRKFVDQMIHVIEEKAGE